MTKNKKPELTDRPSSTYDFLVSSGMNEEIALEVDQDNQRKKEKKKKHKYDKNENKWK